MLILDCYREHEHVDPGRLYNKMYDLTDRFIHSKTNAEENLTVKFVLRQIQEEARNGYQRNNGKKQSGMCRQCEYKPWCTCDCPTTPDKVTQHRCKIIQAYYGGVIDVLLKNYGGISC